VELMWRYWNRWLRTAGYILVWRFRR
jgi:hypothetical protein